MKHLILLLSILIMSSCGGDERTESYLNLHNKLNGNWKAKAFDGELHEKWSSLKNGWIQQEGYYIENRDTIYSAKTRIEKINNELILLSVIKDSNPKIFKATHISDSLIVFENDDYKNPFQVTYEFINTNKYRRTIKGHEKDSLVIYQFNFEKIK